MAERHKIISDALERNVYGPRAKGENSTYSDKFIEKLEILIQVYEKGLTKAGWYPEDNRWICEDGEERYTWPPEE